MRDTDCVAFLQWALPRLNLRWRGYRKVRRQVCRRIDRRIEELGLVDASEYRVHLAADPAEWELLASLCGITISRFYRDKRVFDFLREKVLPTLASEARAQRRAHLSVWSAGCASGEEPYTLALAWGLGTDGKATSPRLDILATDFDGAVLRRAREACYPASSVRDLPPMWLEHAFDRRDDHYCLREEHRHNVVFKKHDVREQAPAGHFDLILCRNLAFTYFDHSTQSDVLARFLSSLRPRGALVIGAHERLPAGAWELDPWNSQTGVYRRREPRPHEHG